MKITQFRCKNNAQDIGTRCNFNIFADGVSKLVFRIWNENKKLKYSGFVSERQEKKYICITHKSKRRQFSAAAAAALLLPVCIYVEEKDTWFLMYCTKLMLFYFVSHFSIWPSRSHIILMRNDLCRLPRQTFMEIGSFADYSSQPVYSSMCMSMPQYIQCISSVLFFSRTFIWICFCRGILQWFFFLFQIVIQCFYFIFFLSIVQTKSVFSIKSNQIGF